MGREESNTASEERRELECGYVTCTWKRARESESNRAEGGSVTRTSDMSTTDLSRHRSIVQKSENIVECERAMRRCITTTENEAGKENGGDEATMDRYSKETGKKQQCSETGHGRTISKHGKTKRELEQSEGGGRGGGDGTARNCMNSTTIFHRQRQRRRRRAEQTIIAP